MSNTNLNHAAEIFHYEIEAEKIDSDLADGRHGNYRCSPFFHKSKQSLEHLSAVWLVTHVS